MPSQVVDVEKLGNKIQVERKNGVIEQIPYTHSEYADLLKNCFSYHHKHYHHHKKVGERIEKQLKAVIKP